MKSYEGSKISKIDKKRWSIRSKIKEKRDNA